MSSNPNSSNSSSKVVSCVVVFVFLYSNVASNTKICRILVLKTNLILVLLETVTILDEATALPSHFTPVLLALAVNSMDGWDRITTDRTVSDSSTVRNAAVGYYGLASRKHCQILGERTKCVLNAHIWPDHNKSNLVLVDLKPSDIDNPKNILRLHCGIERYFDHKQLTFTQAGGEFHLKVLDPNIKTEVLEGTNVALNDVDGSPLIFPNDHMPWRRLLATHSIIAHRHARNNGWLPEDELTTAELNANDLIVFSLDAEAQARVKRFLQT
jgi:hypothetical protein